jgi:hypothetical protein
MLFGVTPFCIGRHVYSFIPTRDSHLFVQNAERRYPYLFRLTMDILLVQASAVACKQLFSSGKETCTPCRNRINPDLMEALQILKFSFCSRGLDLTKHVEDMLYLSEQNPQA